MHLAVTNGADEQTRYRLPLPRFDTAVRNANSFRARLIAALTPQALGFARTIG